MHYIFLENALERTGFGKYRTASALYMSIHKSLVLSLLLVFLGAGCADSTQQISDSTVASSTVANTDQSVQSQFSQKVDDWKKQLAEKYNGLTNWDDGITYTSQLQDLVKKGKVLIFQSDINDVYSDSGKVFLRLEPFTLENEYYFNVECSPEIVSKTVQEEKDATLSKSSHRGHIFAVRITDAKKPLLRFSPQLTDSGEAEITLNDSNAFLLQGVCIDAINLNQ